MRSLSVSLVVTCACAASAKEVPRPPLGPNPATLEGAAVPAGALAVSHAGVGTEPALADGAQHAAEAAHGLLELGQSALEAAIEGTASMEDDPRYNAGTGSNIRLDGKTIQMDASLMTSDGKFAAVAVIEHVKNPIRVARLVLDSPHVLMAGEGATRFAHKLGVEDVYPVSDAAEAKYRKRIADLTALVNAPGSKEIDWRDYWNFPGEMPEEMKAWKHGGDTVGTVARGKDGTFAATLSTGGTSVTLYGRVGDVPVYGAGVYAGPKGAVACTGKGEEIIRRALARSVYEEIAAGVSPQEAVHRAVNAFPADASVGLIAVGVDGYGVAANRPMAYGVAR